jgi:hypothetical protein
LTALSKTRPSLPLLREAEDFLGLYFSTISIIAKRVAEMKEHPE